MRNGPRDTSDAAADGRTLPRDLSCDTQSWVCLKCSVFVRFAFLYSLCYLGFVTAVETRGVDSPGLLSHPAVQTQ